jgi:hypothetical protein
MLVTLAACQRTTGDLDEAQLRRFADEGIVRRAVDLSFRRTRGVGTDEARWKVLTASIVVTKVSVVIHRGSTFELEIAPRALRELAVARHHDRVRLRTGSGKSVTSWSFRPPDDAAGWTADIRAVIGGTAGEARRAREGAASDR